MIHLATVTKTNRQAPDDIPDHAFLDALDFEFRAAPSIAREMLANGTPATLTMIRQRMNEFVAYSPDIEAGEDAWRITPTAPTLPPLPANDDHQMTLPTSAGEPLLVNGCGLEMLRGLPDASIDLALLDLPYGITRTTFDPVIDVDAHMNELRRVVTSTGAIVCFATQPFTTRLINAGLDIFKQSLVWEKPQGTGFAQARQRHLKCHEDILVFSKGTVIGGERSKQKMTFNPQGAVEVERVLRKRNTKYMNDVRSTAIGRRYMALTNCPRSVLRYPKDSKGHSFAKPIALLEYLIRTFSNDNALILDHTMGSGSTGVAAYRTGRRFIGAENGFIKDGTSIFKIAASRINAELTGQDNSPPTPPKPRGGKSQKKPRAWSPEQRTKYEATMAGKRAATPASNDNAKYAVPTSTIHQGDCLKVMRDMPAKSVDMIFTSPPYNLGVSTGGGLNDKTGKWKGMALANGYASYDDARAPTDYIAWQKDCLTEMWRLLRDDGAIFYNHKPRVQQGILQTPLDLNPGLPVRQIVIWNRRSGFNYSPTFYCPAHEWIVIFAKPGFRLRDRKASGAQDVWTIQHERNNNHPAPFPVELPQRAIETTTAQVILDPFAGSGTTGVAAKRLGRSFIGIKLDPGYCETARDRIAAEPLPLAA